MAFNNLVNNIRTGLGGLNTALNAFDGITGRGRDGAEQEFNVQKLKSQITESNGLMRPNLFLVQCTNPLCIVENRDEPSRFLVSSATLPGKMITVQPHRRLGYGTEDRRITGAVMPDVTLTFFVGNNGQPLTYFNEWFEYLFYTNGTKGSEGASSQRGVPLFNIGFRDQYISTIDILLYDQTHNNFLKYTLHEAFPMQIGDVSLAWAENDSFASVAINFTYRYYTMSTIEGPDVNTSVSGGFLTSIRNGLGVINRLASSTPASTVLQALNIAGGQKLF